MPSRNPESVKAARRRWYARNTEHAKSKVIERKKALREWFEEYKSGLICSLCPENHPACLEFHHLDPKKKEINLSLAVVHGWSKKRILEEISKCQVLCANCHRKVHSNKYP